MRRRPEILVVGLVAVVLATAAILGILNAPEGLSSDSRLSTRLTTPGGASAIRAALSHYGVNVTERRRSWYDLGRFRASDSAVMLAVLRPAKPLAVQESRALRDWVSGGGSLLLAGTTNVTGCFGYAVTTTMTKERVLRAGALVDSIPDDVLPPPRARLTHFHHLADDTTNSPLSRLCEPRTASAVEVLWLRNKDTIALRLRYRSGGSVLIIADGDLLSNQDLRRTGAGPRVVGWLLQDHLRALVVDEFHQGYGNTSSLSGAALAWAGRDPGGWLAIQLVAAALLALLIAAIRFGPAVPSIVRRRRSPLEHLDALAAGLERGRAAGTAIRLLVGGLKRRLAVTPAKSGEAADRWLDELALRIQTENGREAIKRLHQQLDKSATGADVVRAANALEDVWETLKAPTPQPR
ncbi:MAG TPA: DUF4350 domain-containing protein [Gemmatimonadales bacterium]